MCACVLFILQKIVFKRLDWKLDNLSTSDVTRLGIASTVPSIETLVCQRGMLKCISFNGVSLWKQCRRLPGHSLKHGMYILISAPKTVYLI